MSWGSPHFPADELESHGGSATRPQSRSWEAESGSDLGPGAGGGEEGVKQGQSCGGLGRAPSARGWGPAGAPGRSRVR